MDVVLPALVGALAGLFGGLLTPRLIALCPEPAHNPDENPEDFPEHVPFVQLAARPGLAWRCALACTVAGTAIGATAGWSWALLWLLPLVPVCCALTVVDYVTWYLPTRLIWPSYLVVALGVAVTAVALGEVNVLLFAAGGFVGLGGYYGLLWLISPRLMAFGDVRLGALLGLALGPLGIATLLYSVAAAAVVGVLAFIPMKLRGNAIKREGSRGLVKHHVPFGPSLVLGALVAVIAGQVLVRVQGT
ncbi:MULTISPECIES: prepilin peptidase [Nocardioides]|uniref:Prepilin peptidase n=1 Tax=Nocardioides vastitatis TaxID=2568655 RepID=A0ABW0ZNM9_9ACTN|nr:prepilin peptidase [Nocardioides sp.]THJ07310.1 hypothetical protein E7Z54_05550 [Nocardioides sp.]